METEIYFKIIQYIELGLYKFWKEDIYDKEAERNKIDVTWSNGILVKLGILQN